MVKEPEKLTRRQSQAQRPRKDAAARNITPWALWNKVPAFGLPMTLGNGAQTQDHRSKLDVPKTPSARRGSPG
ncbi:MAG: hypothetical protein LBR11_03365 [Deltaproteobacteria bacterium]|nr:hypothetical protein [Deltaproteobacteria bacterium]